MVTTARLGKWDKMRWNHLLTLFETEIVKPRDAASVKLLASLISLIVISKLMHKGRIGVKVSWPGFVSRSGRWCFIHIRIIRQEMRTRRRQDPQRVKFMDNVGN